MEQFDSDMKLAPHIFILHGATETPRLFDKIPPHFDYLLVRPQSIRGLRCGKEHYLDPPREYGIVREFADLFLARFDVSIFFSINT